MPAEPRFRRLKAAIRPWLRRQDWSPALPLPAELADIAPASMVNPLFACLAEGGDMTDRAAFALGGVIRHLHEQSPEDAKNVMRRFMWHMNEESGNIGWGIPEGFAQAVAQCPPLADAFRRVLFSYVRDKEGDSTYCDHAPLRRSCYKAIGIVLDARPDLLAEALPLLRAGGNDDDPECRQIAAMLANRYPAGESLVSPAC